jgi:hypothetical protein
MIDITRPPSRLLLCRAMASEAQQCTHCSQPCADADAVVSCQVCEATICEKCQFRCSLCTIAVCKHDTELLLDCEDPECRLQMCLMCITKKLPCSCGEQSSKAQRKLAKRGLEVSACSLTFELSVVERKCTLKPAVGSVVTRCQLPTDKCRFY